MLGKFADARIRPQTHLVVIGSAGTSDGLSPGAVFEDRRAFGRVCETGFLCDLSRLIIYILALWAKVTIVSSDLTFSAMSP